MPNTLYSTLASVWLVFAIVSSMDLCDGRVNTMLNRYSTWNRKNTSLFSRYYHPKVSSYDIHMFGYINLVNVKNILPKKVRPGTPCICTHTHIHDVCTETGQRNTAISRGLYLTVDESRYCVTHRSPVVTILRTICCNT
jgi:hypothetical protein